MVCTEGGAVPRCYECRFADAGCELTLMAYAFLVDLDPKLMTTPVMVKPSLDRTSQPVTLSASPLRLRGLGGDGAGGGNSLRAQGSPSSSPLAAKAQAIVGGGGFGNGQECIG